jgi:hypothetical protein
VASPSNSPPAGNRFDGAAGNQFGGAPAPVFGAPAPVFGAPAPVFGSPARVDAWRAGPPGRANRSMSSAVKVVAIVVGLVLVAGSVMAGQFGWRHFAATPALPDTLQGMPQVTDPATQAGLAEVQQRMSETLTKGSEVKAGLYSSGNGTGYIVLSMRGGSGPDEDSDDLADAAQTTFGKVECFEMPTQAGLGDVPTLCVRAFFRRAVAVLVIGASPPAATVAQATDEAWAAQ